MFGCFVIRTSLYTFNIKAQSNTKEVILILNVMHGKEIDIEYNKKNIIDKINSYFGYIFIKNIQIKIMNTKYIGSMKTENVKKIKSNFDKVIKKIEDINLKNKLEKLISAYNEKK